MNTQIFNLKVGMRGKIALIPWLFLTFFLITGTANSAEIKIATYNIEHMDRIIDESLNVVLEDRCHAIASNIKALDPDILAIEEAPGSEEQLKMLVDEFLDGKYNVYFEKSRDQSLALLIKKDIRPTCSVIKISRREYRKKWKDDVDGDGREEHWKYSFSRPPLEVDLKFDCGTLKIVVLHLKSKFATSLREKVLARYKLIAQARKLREIIQSEMDKDIIILGDMNDNPGFEDDPYERELGIDGIAELIGSPPNQLKSSLRHIDRKWRFTCIYFNDATRDPDVGWIDRILFTKALNQEPITYKRKSGKIHHELLDPLASDHIPVSGVFIVGEE